MSSPHEITDAAKYVRSLKDAVKRRYAGEYLLWIQAGRTGASPGHGHVPRLGESRDDEPRRSQLAFDTTADRRVTARQGRFLGARPFVSKHPQQAPTAAQ